MSKIEKSQKNWFSQQAPNVFTSSRPDLINDGEWRAHCKSELRETCIPVWYVM